MAGYGAINRPDLAKSAGGGMTPEAYRRQEKKLEETCRQFEGIMFSKIWKDMLKSARNFGEAQEKKRAYGPLEDTVVEMVSEHLSESQGGVGLWRVLYDHLHACLPAQAAPDSGSGGSLPGPGIGDKPDAGGRGGNSPHDNDSRRNAAVRNADKAR